ncbi:hypothetical protein EMCRGX_G000160 [Ephydatia muelleri]
MPIFQAAPNVTALNAVTALSNPNSLLIQGFQSPQLLALSSSSINCPVVHNLQPSTQYSFVEAACTTAGCQTGGVANVTTLDSGVEKKQYLDAESCARFCAQVPDTSLQVHSEYIHGYQHFTPSDPNRISAAVHC